MTGTTSALAIHICADLASAGPDRWWPAMVASEDTVRRAAKLCRHVGIVEQRSLAGEGASRAGLLAVLRDASAALADDGLLVLTFAGHTERGDRPIEAAQWCLFDGGLELSQIAAELARFPARARLVIIVDSCYAAAIARVLAGPQPALVLACCGEDQTTIDRASSELMVRLEDFICAGEQGSVDALRRRLEDDTPDSERPEVWTNTDAWWSATAIAPGHMGVSSRAANDGRAAR